MGCGPWPYWLQKRHINATRSKSSNICTWYCLSIHQKLKEGDKRPGDKTEYRVLKNARIFYKTLIIASKVKESTTQNVWV